MVWLLKVYVGCMQADLEHMHLPVGIRTRLQAAMPLLLPTPPTTIAAGPPQISNSALSLLQFGVSSGITASTIIHQGAFQKPLNPVDNNVMKAKTVAVPDTELEVDPWTLLEDGVGASSGPIGGGEVGNLKACPWLKGAVRVRRSDLTYVGPVDEDT